MKNDEKESKLFDKLEKRIRTQNRILRKLEYTPEERTDRHLLNNLKNAFKKPLKRVIFGKMKKKYRDGNAAMIYRLAQKSHGKWIIGYDYNNEHERLESRMQVRFIMGSRYLIWIQGKAFWDVPVNTIFKFMKLLKLQYNRFVSLENGVFVLQKTKSHFLAQGLYPELYEKLFPKPKKIVEEFEEYPVIVTESTSPPMPEISIDDGDSDKVIESETLITD